MDMEKCLSHPRSVFLYLEFSYENFLSGFHHKNYEINYSCCQVLISNGLVITAVTWLPIQKQFSYSCFPLGFYPLSRLCCIFQRYCVISLLEKYTSPSPTFSAQFLYTTKKNWKCNILNCINVIMQSSHLHISFFKKDFRTPII